MTYVEYAIAFFTALNTLRVHRVVKRVKAEGEAIRRHVTKSLYQDRQIRGGEVK